MISPFSPPAPTVDRNGQARLAGLFYVLVVVFGIFALDHGPSIAFAGATDVQRLSSMTAHVDLVRLIVVGEVLCYVSFAALAVALHRLFAPIDGLAAGLLAVFALISVPFGFANVAHLLEIARAVEAPATQTTLDIATTALSRHRAGLLLQSTPWGLWLIPFGWLVIRCGFLPRVIGVGLILAGLGYVTHFIARLAVDGYTDTIWPRVLGAPRVFEIVIAAWLLIFGARAAPWRRKTAPEPAPSK